MIYLEGFLDLLEAVFTDTLAVEENYIVGVGAEDAGGLIFLKDYSVLVGEDLKRILLADVHSLTDADGEHYATQLVYFSYDSG